MMKSVLLLNLLVTATSASIVSDFAHNKPNKNAGLRGVRDLKGHKQGQQKQRGSKPDKMQYNNAYVQNQPINDNTSQPNNVNNGQPQGTWQHNVENQGRGKNGQRNPKMKPRNAGRNKQNKYDNPQRNYVNENVEGGDPNEGRGKKQGGGRFSKPDKQFKNQRYQDVERVNPALVVTNAPTWAPDTPEPTQAPTLKATTDEPTSIASIAGTTNFPSFSPTRTPTSTTAVDDVEDTEDSEDSEDAELEEAAEEEVPETLRENGPELQACPAAYDTVKDNYVGGDLIEVQGHSFECHSIYFTYCNILEWNDDLLDENEDAKEAWNMAWTHLGPCQVSEEAEEQVEDAVEGEAEVGEEEEDSE